ncbi:SOS response-associated peptidase [Zhihengliuella flava]|uniref:Abasic site processing protein n=1 Tax=Zhihengliuella flava TaxID=1285193 RepID=A0A931D748_9MICC|nr:SOS response-associated peptidase [Zhihengliuella flava]MBG6083322.1 putative SOS response-associated peptidase YedK [Zhihengliuella flava]
MCGRYVMARATGDLLAEADAVLGEQVEAEDLSPSWNVAPTTNVPIVVERLQGTAVHREVYGAHWGLVPRWAKDRQIGVRAFNARSETVTEKPMFRSAVVTRRCAVPMDGYYEWKRQDTGAKAQKQPYFVHPADGSLAFFAGLYEWWRDPSVPEDSAGGWMLSTSIVTRDSPDPAAAGVLGELGQLHDRLPVPLSEASMQAWIDCRDRNAAVLVERVRQDAYAVAKTWQLDPVSAAVGNVRNNAADLISPVKALF